MKRPPLIINIRIGTVVDGLINCVAKSLARENAEVVARLLLAVSASFKRVLFDHRERNFLAICVKESPAHADHCVWLH
jgi:hypothetical protein